MDPTEADPPLVLLYNTRCGDTWRGIPTVGPVTVREGDSDVYVPPSANLVSVKCFLTREGAKSPSLRMRSNPTPGDDTDAVITIQDAHTWEFTLPAIAPGLWHPTPLPPGVYLGDIETTDADGYVLTTHQIQVTFTPDRTT